LTLCDIGKRKSNTVELIESIDREGKFMSLYDGSLFEETAEYYVRYRPGIPQVVIDYLRSRYVLDGTGELLDLGCGTGQLTHKLAPLFQKVLCIDPNPDMLRLAQEKDTAGATSQGSIEWRLGYAEDLEDDLGPFRLVSICRAFHWMDQYNVLAWIARHLEPSGGLAIIGDGSFWTGQENWQRTTKHIVQIYLGEKRRAGKSHFQNTNEPYEDMLRKTGFDEVETCHFTVQRTWHFREIVGCLYSTSFASPRFFGKEQKDFERDLHDALGCPTPENTFKEIARFTVNSGFWRR
jgi:ubiquinone/menaquinone biosynthesis C-methylase UbiE